MPPSAFLRAAAEEFALLSLWGVEGIESCHVRLSAPHGTSTARVDVRVQVEVVRRGSVSTTVCDSPRQTASGAAYAALRHAFDIAERQLHDRDGRPDDDPTGRSG